MSDVGTQTSESATAGFCSNAAAAAAAFLLANSARRRSSAKDVAGCSAPSRSGGADASGPANGTGEEGF